LPEEASERYRYIRNLSFLAATLNSDERSLRLHAINALGNIGERARPALPAILTASLSSDVDGPGAAARYTARILTGTYVPSP
jgi:hypothetical protein